MEGYDAKFDPPLDKRLECPICLLAQREPMQTPCGHRFCSTCILRALRETGPRCPVDNTRVSNHQLFKDNFAKREVLSLNVKCPANDYGCLWHGELRSMEIHVNMCDLVNIECPNCCGHFCQRKELCPHLAICVNKPEQCEQCSIYFTRNRMTDHLPHCSGLILPESIQSNLLKANEVLKWCGYIKLKITSPYSSMFNQVPNSIFQVSGYLTAKIDSPESVMFTGNWSSSLSLMPVNSSSAKIFWRMLHGPEVQTKIFGFGLINNDSGSSMLSKVLKRKLNDLNAIVGLHLKAGPSRNDLTIIYLYWSEPKRRLMACVAELKSHLVKQMQNRLHLQQQISNRRGRTTTPDSVQHPPGHGQSHLRSSQARNSARPLPQAHQHFSPPGHIQHHHIHPHIHPRHPTAAVALVTPGPGSQPHQHHPHHVQQAHSHQHHTIVPSQLHQASAGQSSLGHPRILSWQMSQSLNGYPWRVQAGNVPFFTFPSTPPSFLPANPYPYTFAPVPPFSINHIAQVPTTAVPVPSYAGIAVPQVTGVDSIVTGPGGNPFHVAAMPSLTDVNSEQMRAVPAGTVAVTLASGNGIAGQPAAATVVIQQSVIQSNQDTGGLQNQDMTVIHTIAPPPPTHAHYQTSQIPAHIAPAIIAPDGTPAARVVQNQPVGSIGGDGVTLGRYHGPIVAALPPHLITMGTPPQHSVVGMPVDSVVSIANTSQRHVDHRPGFIPHEYHQTSSNIETTATSSDHFPLHSDGHGHTHSSVGSSHNRTISNIQTALYNEGAGPSRNLDSGSSDSDSSASGSPNRNFASMFYASRPFHHIYNDSDDSSDNPTEIESSDREIYRHQRDGSGLSEESQISSDPDDTFSPSESEIDSPTDPSTLRMIGNTAAGVTLSTTDDTHVEAELNSDVPSSEDSDPLSLPVLINISDSDSGTSRVVTPTSLTDLTSSSSSHPETSLSSTLSPSPSNHIQVPNGEHHVISSVPYNEITTSGPVFVPVINNTENTQIIAQREVARYFDVTMSGQRPDLIEDSTSLNQDTSMINHPVVQMTQLHHTHGRTPQMYASQGHVAQAHGHILQQSHLQNNQTYHSHSHDPATQPVYPNSNLAPGNVAIGVQQISSIPLPPTATVVPMESPNAPIPHSNVHVLSWQQAIGQQQHPGEMIGSHHTTHPPVPSHSNSPSGFASHHGVEPIINPINQQQTLAGNFWETVMPSLDMSLQGNITSSESTRP